MVKWSELELEWRLLSVAAIAMMVGGALVGLATGAAWGGIVAVVGSGLGLFVVVATWD
ncbi:MAG: hypothetical protein L3K16_08250 [Thermoplasmata archaeon]|nr:hypothetical protein [Thermoplasmata archaeon]